MSENSGNVHSMVNILKNVEFDPKQNTVISASLPSLQYLSLSKIAISLWKSHLKRFNLRGARIYSYDNACNIKKNILKSIPNLMITKPCEDLLKPMINSTVDELTENFLVKKLITFKKFRVYPDNLCFNEQGAFSILKTVIKIINETNLSNLEKYELACHFCLKEKIRDLRNKVSKNDIENLDNEPVSLIKFWSIYIKDENFPVTGMSTSQYLLNSFNLEGPLNEIALQFIWENFADEMWKTQLVCIVSIILKRKLSAGDNMFLYFFKQMSQKQLKKIRSEFHFPVLKKLHAISRWNNEVSVPEYALDLIKSRDMYDGFSVIRYCWFDGNFLNVKDLIIMWNQFVQYFKLDLEKAIVELYNSFKFGAIPSYKEGLIVKLIISVANPGDREKILYSRKTMEYCKRLIYENLPQCFDEFLNQIFLEEDISHFQNEFVRVIRMDLCADLIIDLKYVLLDKIVFQFCTDETVSKFKKKYCLDILDSVLKNVRGRRGKLLTIIFKYLSWCFNGNKKDMARYKALVFDLDSYLYSNIRNNFFIILKSFIKRGKWNLVRKYWKWILFANKKNTTKPMEKFALSKGILIATYGKESSFTYLQNINCHGLLKRFMTTCFNQDEVEEIKEKLHFKTDLSLLVKELIELENLPEVEDILEWSFSSDNIKIANFKSKFMNSNGCSLLFHFIERYDNIEKAKSIITWFNPSVESAESFEENFIDCYEFRDKIHSINLGGVIEITEFQKIERKILNEKIDICLKLLNCYKEGQVCLDQKNKEVPSQDSKKRKMMEEEDPSRKRLNVRC